MSESIITEDNIFIKKAFENKEEAISYMSDRLIDGGRVKKAFKKAVIERENNHPTGLLAGDINLAIPHAEHTHVKKTAISLCTLEKPVTFHRMDNPSEEIKVSVIILLALNNPDTHLKTLKGIFSLVEDYENLEKVYNADNKPNILDILNGL